MSPPLRIARNVHSLPHAASFYTAIGFTPAGPAQDNPALAACLQLSGIRSQFFNLGAQSLELTQCDPAGAGYPADARGNDLCFQHIALLTSDIAAAAARALAAGATAISNGGPQQLPPEAGGVIAFKFRDPEGHPLEYLQFPEPRPAGYDHSAISISNIDATLAFYKTLGFALAARQLNTGLAQQRLDGLESPVVDVIALKPAIPTPHLELLHYRTPAAPARHWALNDIAADRLVISAPDSNLAIRRDPDGHIILLDSRLAP